MERIYSDTSVLLSYIQHWVERNNSVLGVINSSEHDLHTGLTVHNELLERREVRTNLYKLLLSITRREDSLQIESMDAEQLPYVSPPPTGNDKGHFEDLIKKLQDLSSENTVTIAGEEMEYQGSEDNPFFLREYQAEARSREREILDSISICEKEYDEELKDSIDSVIDNSQDSKVLAEAVEWRYVYSESQPDKLVTLDRWDMCEQETEINEKITDIKSEYANLDIVMPSDID